MIINDTKTYAETSRSYTGNLSLMTNIYTMFAHLESLLLIMP